MADDDNSWILLVVCILGFGFLIFVFTEMSKEAFQSGMPGVRCGVDLPTCAFGLKCMNGFCKKPSQPVLLPNQLSVYP
jgi:hypothetical protein